MRNLRIAIALAGLAVFPCLAAAQEAPPVSQPVHAPIVVELYTSQGCSSCPPADELLAMLAKQDDVLALALHVDYWDYIGWKDNFASPAFTQRQKDYAQAGSRRMIYTPQMVIMGFEDVVGANAPAVTEAISRYRNKPPVVAMTAQKIGDQVTVKAFLVQDVETAAPLLVHVARYNPMQSVSITSGELRGRTIAYANVVRSLDVVGQWDGTGEFTVTVPMNAAQKTAFFVQSGASGPILGAVKLD